jgi:hypothetical protein
MSVRAHLIDVLLGKPETAGTAISCIQTLDAWGAAIRMAEAWGVIAPLRRRLAELSVRLPPDWQSSLSASFKKSFIASTLRAHQGLRLCHDLAERGVPVVVFKGLAAIAHLYNGVAGVRKIVDVDILVRPGDLPRALEAIAALGFLREDGGSFSDYAAFVKNSPGFAGNEAISAGSLDIHWSLGPNPASEFRIEAFFERALPVTLFDTRVRVVSPEDCLLLTAHHAMRENFAPDGMLRDVLDAAGWFAMLHRNGRLSIALERARRCRIEEPILALAGILRQQGNGPVGLGPASESSAMLSKLFFLQIREGPLDRDMAYLADPHSARQIVRAAFSGWSRHASQMHAFESRLNGSPVPAGQRIARMLRNVCSLRPGRWRMLRTLAKTRAAYQRIESP